MTLNLPVKHGEKERIPPTPTPSRLPRPRHPVKAVPRKTTPKKAVMRNTAARPAPAGMGVRTKIGPGGNGAVGSMESADGKSRSIYAAPCMPVNVDNPKKVEGYNGPAPTRPKGGTTLTSR